jgi:hypothetical protein
VSGVRNALRDLLAGGQQGSPNLVLALVIALLVGLVVAVVVYVLYMSSTRGRIRSAAGQKATVRRGTAVGLQVLAVALFAALLFATVQYLERPSTCAQCHAGGKYSDSVALSPHEGVECAECHRATGITGPAQDLATYVRWVGVYAGRRTEPEVQAGSVGNDPCLDCHEEIREGTVVRGGVRVRHSDFLEAGWACRECHNSTGHPDVVIEPSSPTMDKCLPCHDGVNASSECETCHTQEVGSPSHQDELPKVNLTGDAAQGSCYGCHAQADCTSCHGIPMPHPGNWLERGQQGNHMREGFANRELCWRCHYGEGGPSQANYDFCRQCHDPSGGPHGDNKAWIRRHGVEATGQAPGENGMCFACHNDSLCDNCHPASYGDERYNPVGSPYPE